MKNVNHDRRLKRRWLHAIGALKRETTISPSDPIPLTAALIDETLGSIKNDDVWVASACINAIYQKLPPLFNDAILLRHIIVLGIRVTEKSASSADVALDGPEQTTRLLALRTRIIRYRRMLDVWNKVYGPEADKFASRWDFNEADDQNPEDEEPDAWAELQDTTPSPIAPQAIRTSALEFILSSPSKKAMELAIAAQPLQLSSFLRALPKALAAEVFPQRFNIVKALVIAISASESDMTVLAKAQLLPYVNEDQEVGLWIQTEQNSTAEQPDFSDLSEIRTILQTKGLNWDDRETVLNHGRFAIENEKLTPTALCAFYKEVLQHIESQVASILSASQLSLLITSKEFGLPVDQELSRSTQDFQLLTPLVYSPSSSPQVRQWSLAQFRQACSAACDSVSRTDLAFLYLCNAQGQESALEAVREGVLPLFRVLAKRDEVNVQDDVQIEKRIQKDLIDLYLRLIEKDKIRILSYVLFANVAESVSLEFEEKTRILISAVLNANLTDRTTQEALQTMLNTLGSSLGHVEANKVSRNRLREAIAPALKQYKSAPSTPSITYKFLESSTIDELKIYLQRIQICQQAAINLSIFTDQANVAWLVELEGEKEEQSIGVTRLVRTFGRSANHSQMFSQFAMALRNEVGNLHAFDQLSEKDVAKVVLEGAARVGDLHLFDQILHSEISHALTTQEHEDIIIDASEEFYDNSNSANLHQGEMKLAYDILSRVPNASTSQRALRNKAFIEATSRLCSYRVPSKIHTGALLSPIEIRLSRDRLDLIRLLLSARTDAYRTPDVIMDVAYKLCAVAPGARQDPSVGPIPPRSQIENTTLALMIDAALSQADYVSAQSFCERLVTSTINLSKRVEQIQQDGGLNNNTTTATNLNTIELYEEAKSFAHRSCHQLSKQPDWNDYASRLRWAGFALAFCPSEQLGKYLQNWRSIAHELEQELERNPPKEITDLLIAAERNGLSARLNLSGVGATTSSLVGGGLSAALQAGTGGLSAAGLAALSQFGGNLESYANPLGALFSRAPSAIRPLASSNLTRSGSQKSTNSTQTGIRSVAVGGVQMEHQSSSDSQGGSPISRAARLFDGLGGGGGGGSGGGNSTGNSSTGGTPSEGMPGYMDPAERAARAARRFFSGFGG